MRVPVKVLFQGKVSLRDYLVRQCIEKGEKCEVSHDGEIMTMSPEELTSKRVSVSPKEFPSKFGTPAYKLFNYWWEPDQIEL